MDNINEITIMKDRILELLNQDSNNSFTDEELLVSLAIAKDEQPVYEMAKNELINDYDLFISKKKKRYMLPSLAGYNKGTISIKNQNYGFILGTDEDYYVSEDEFAGAFDKDYVLYQVTYRSNDSEFRSEARVVKVLKHNMKYVVGTLIRQYGRFFVEHFEKSLPYHILVTNPNNHKEKEVVRCEITNYSYKDCEAKIIEVIGKDSDIGMDISQVACKYDFALKFPKEVIAEVDNLKYDLEAEKKRRVDYTNKIVFTIDGDDAKDLDDAVSIELLDDGSYKLGVYIADVSYFVTEGSALDIEALSRGTSVYLVDRVIPMLPVRLSNDLCSLNPDQEKLVVCCIMTIDATGEVTSSEITEGIIKTVKRLSYSKCNKVLDEGKDAVADYDKVFDSLKLMNELAKILTAKRSKEGALDFDIPEGKVIVDEMGHPIDVVLRERGTSEKIIEEFMILANNTVASTIELMELPFIYRVHDQPNLTKLADLTKISKSLGYSLRGRYQTQVRTFLGLIKPEHEFLKTLILRMMSKAIYSGTNIGHYGLASNAYTHFTSPIRRYPDLLVHRLLRKYLFKGDINPDEFTSLQKAIDEIATQTSERERAAANCEYDVADMKMAEYMGEHIGEEFDGIITNITNFGMFISLPNTVEGLVKVAQMTDDRYRYNEQFHTLTGTFKNTKYRIGDKVRVSVVKTVKILGEIDFKIVYNKSTKKTSKNGVGVRRGRH